MRFNAFEIGFGMMFTDNRLDFFNMIRFRIDHDKKLAVFYGFLILFNAAAVDADANQGRSKAAKTGADRR